MLPKAIPPVGEAPLVCTVTVPPAPPAVLRLPISICPAAPAPPDFTLIAWPPPAWKFPNALVPPTLPAKDLIVSPPLEVMLKLFDDKGLMFPVPSMSTALATALVVEMLPPEARVIEVV